MTPPADDVPQADVPQADDVPHDECGVFGVWAPGEDVARLTYFGLFALQHRGQEAAGMAVADGHRTVVYKELGLVAQVFDEPVLASLSGHLAVGHTRYSTSGGVSWANAQPSFRSRAQGGSVSVAHNGNLTNTAELARLVREQADTGDTVGATTDSDLITALLAGDGRPLEEAAPDVLRRLQGGFSLVLADDTTLLAARDTHGVRPLVLGRLATGWVVASETAALDIVGASLVREVQPGELVAVDAGGLRAHTWAKAERTSCVFEYVYLARPDSTLAGRSVYAARVEVGRVLAREAPADADIVMPVPDSGTPAAIGFAEASGLPYAQGLVKNSYVGRTFIQPNQTLRQLGIRLKLNPLREVVAGRRLVVVDDSIVRGNTQRALVRMLREAGAREVHVRISSPPVRWPCFYGIDFASRAELVAAGLGPEEVRSAIGADSLGHVSPEGLVAATEQPAEQLCRACFDGVYPIPLPAPAARAQSVVAAPLLGDPETGPGPSDGGDPGPDALDGLLLGVGSRR